MLFNMIASFICGMFLIAFFGGTVASAIALAKSFFFKPFAWEDSFVLFVILFTNVFALIGTYSIITMIGTTA